MCLGAYSTTQIIGVLAVVGLYATRFTAHYLHRVDQEVQGYFAHTKTPPPRTLQ